jgi:hypothetical protein
MKIVKINVLYQDTKYKTVFPTPLDRVPACIPNDIVNVIRNFYSRWLVFKKGKESGLSLEARQFKIALLTWERRQDAASTACAR